MASVWRINDKGSLFRLIQSQRLATHDPDNEIACSRKTAGGTA
jgi:hypothetical protein